MGDHFYHLSIYIKILMSPFWRQSLIINPAGDKMEFYRLVGIKFWNYNSFSEMRYYRFSEILKNECDVLCNLVPVAQCKKRKNHSPRSVTLSTNSSTSRWVFFTFFKLHKWYQIAQTVSNGCF